MDKISRMLEEPGFIQMVLKSIYLGFFYDALNSLLMQDRHHTLKDSGERFVMGFSKGAFKYEWRAHIQCFNNGP